MLGWGACLLLPGFSLAQTPATPDVLKGLSLVQLDSHLGVAVLRGSAGEHRAMHAGDFAPGQSYKLARIYTDRIELEVPQPGVNAPARYWLWKSAPGETSARLEPILRNPPDEGRAGKSVVVGSPDRPGSAR